MLTTRIDEFIKASIKNLELLWKATLSDGTIVYSDYERPEVPHVWERLRSHCQNNDLCVVKIEIIMFGTNVQTVFENENGLDGFFIVRGTGKDLNLSSEENGVCYKHLAVGLLRDNEDFIDVRKYCWPQNEFEQFEQVRSLTPENAKLMIFKNGSTKKNREGVQVALNGTAV